MKRYKLALLLSCPFGIVTNAIAHPVVQVSQGVRGGVSKTVVEKWNLTEEEKKNTVMMMSSLSATAVAPSGKVKVKQWTALTSQHKACFYNTYGSTMSGRYAVKLMILGQEVTSFDSVTVGAGQGFCVVSYLQMWINAQGRGKIETKAYTHVDMDGMETENTGNGVIEAR